MSGTNEMGHRYRCPHCGSQAIVTKPGGGRLACCDTEMEDLTAPTAPGGSVSAG